MPDFDRTEQWPPRWELPPPIDPPAPGPTAPQPVPSPPPRPAAGTADPWPTYRPPPDLPPTADPTPSYPPPPDLPAPADPIATHLPKPRPPAVPGGGSSNAVRMAMATIATALATAAVVLLIVQPWSGTPAPAPVPPPPGPTTQPAPATIVARATEDPGEALRDQADADRSLMAAVPDGDWVPQLSSKRVGLVADGITYSEETIWANHRDLRDRFPDAALLWSGDYATFSGRDFWVTVVPSAASNSPDTANAWCDQHRFRRDDCYAKRISTSSYDRTTKHR